MNLQIEDSQEGPGLVVAQEPLQGIIIVKCRMPEIKNPNNFRTEKSPIKVKEWEQPWSLDQQHNEAVSSRLWVKMIPSLKFYFLLMIN